MTTLGGLIIVGCLAIAGWYFAIIEGEQKDRARNERDLWIDNTEYWHSRCVDQPQMPTQPQATVVHVLEVHTVGCPVDCAVDKTAFSKN